METQVRVIMDADICFGSDSVVGLHYAKSALRHTRRQLDAILSSLDSSALMGLPQLKATASRAERRKSGTNWFRKASVCALPSNRLT